MKVQHKYFKFILTISMLLFFIYYFVINKQYFFKLSHIPLASAAILCYLISSTIVINSMFIKRILREYNKSITIYEAIYVCIISSLANYCFPMGGGVIIKSRFLKTHLNISYSYFISMFYGSYIVIFFINSLSALVSLVLLKVLYNTSSEILFILILALFVGTSILVCVKLPQERCKLLIDSVFNKKMKEYINKCFESYLIFMRNKLFILDLMKLSLYNFLLMCFIAYFELKALNIHVNLFQIIIYTSLLSISLLVALTPGSLGIRELILYIFSDIIGVQNYEIMQLAILDRGLVILTNCFLFFVILLLCRIRRLVTSHQGAAD